MGVLFLTYRDVETKDNMSPYVVRTVAVDIEAYVHYVGRSVEAHNVDSYYDLNLVKERRRLTFKFDNIYNNISNNYGNKYINKNHDYQPNNISRHLRNNNYGSNNKTNNNRSLSDNNLDQNINNSNNEMVIDEITRQKRMKQYLGGLYPKVEQSTMMPYYLRDTLEPTRQDGPEGGSDVIFFWHIPKVCP